MRKDIKDQLDEIMRETQTLITCIGRNDELERSVASLQILGTGLEIEGPEAFVKEAKVRCLAMLDKMVHSKAFSDNLTKKTDFLD
jgi:hypothetical protein